MSLTHVYERARSLAQFTKDNVLGIANRWVHLGLAAIVSLLGAAALAGPALATPQPASTPYTFTTLDNQGDPTFNQVLGINQSGTIAGYFGSGAAGHPNKGYLLSPPYGQSSYVSENFPGSVQTQVTGLNDRGVTVGFWSDQNNANQVNANFGFYTVDGHTAHTVMFPTDDNATPPRQPAARRQRPQRRSRLLHRRRGQQPRLHVQHPPSPLPRGHRSLARPA